MYASWILLVEDDPLLARAVMRCFAPIPVEWVVDEGEDELARLVAELGPPRVAIIDHDLGAGRFGSEVASWLPASVPVVYWTGRPHAVERGAFVVLKTEVKELEALVRTLGSLSR